MALSLLPDTNALPTAKLSLGETTELCRRSGRRSSDDRRTARDATRANPAGHRLHAYCDHRVRGLKRALQVAGGHLSDRRNAVRARRDGAGRLEPRHPARHRA